MCIMDHQQQEMSSQTLESMLVCTKPDQDQKKPRPAEQQPQKCPRCDSANTKFCYYNNYSLTQPRYFCKSCRRYWTKGGTLRNVPVGGGCRKNKKLSSTTLAKRSSQDNISPNISNPIPSYDSSTDLSLAFARLQKQTNAHLEIDQEHDNNNNNNMSMMYNTGNNCTSTAFLDALRGGFLENAPNHHGLFHHNMYNYANMGQLVENGEMGMSYDQDQMSIGTSTTMMTAIVKQEMCNMARSTEGHDLNNSNNNNKVLCGFPWQQMNGDHHVNNMNTNDFEYSTNKQSWNGFGGSSNWHGLINSPLM
ncbi:dof zinc finger protein DOF2.1-like [Solanum verrucosum]|uniref:dof zinc finger protein DOF2.1-like n=1 Tax=Solanum verrucosum TaxID=315347 RepID=UPI0020D0B45B|nr:dof zinc finger protein DOF2.1-like [Solanum verrucosum]